MLHSFELMLMSGDLTVVESLDIPPNPERRAPVPSAFLVGSTGEWLKSGFAADGSLWCHQSKALQGIERGSRNRLDGYSVW
jgi:hypothetical protein